MPALAHRRSHGRLTWLPKLLFQDADTLAERHDIAVRRVVHNSLVANLLGAVGKLDGGDGLWKRTRDWRDVGNQKRLGIASERVLQQRRQTRPRRGRGEATAGEAMASVS